MQTQGLFTRRRPMLAMMAQEALMKQDILKKKEALKRFEEKPYGFLCHVCNATFHLEQELLSHPCAESTKPVKPKKKSIKRSKVAK